MREEREAEEGRRERSQTIYRMAGEVGGVRRRGAMEMG
jgi:hypothetical protein